MSAAGLVGMRAAGGDVLNVALALSAQDWRRPSAAAGWTVQDVFTHIGSLLELLQAAVTGAEAPASGVEALNDRVVAERRAWTSSQTVSLLQDQISSALAVFEPLQQEPLASTEVPMLDLGHYPLHAIADMFTFDMTTHLRLDILAPRGPLAVPVLPLDAMRLGPAVSWLISGIAQMQPDLADRVIAPIDLRLHGPGARAVQVRADAGTVTVQRPGGPGGAAATIESSTADFLGWSTRRLPWAGRVRITGDEHVATEFLDALNLI